MRKMIRRNREGISLIEFLCALALLVFIGSFFTRSVAMAGNARRVENKVKQLQDARRALYFVTEELQKARALIAPALLVESSELIIEDEERRTVVYRLVEGKEGYDLLRQIPASGEETLMAAALSAASFFRAGRNHLALNAVFPAAPGSDTQDNRFVSAVTLARGTE